MLGEIASFIAIAMARLILGDETAAQLCRSFGMSGELGRSTGRERVVDQGVLGSLVRAMGKTTRLETSDAASLRRQTGFSLVSRIAFGGRRCVCVADALTGDRERDLARA